MRRLRLALLVLVTVLALDWCGYDDGGPPWPRG